MPQVHETVFISYRRENANLALSVYHALKQHEYECFLDTQKFKSGDWLNEFLDEIIACAHFVLILTPTTLAECNDAHDILRKEVECAVDNNRHIIILQFENANIGKMEEQLVSPELKNLPKYNALSVPDDRTYFDAAITKLVIAMRKFEEKINKIMEDGKAVFDVGDYKLAMELFESASKMNPRLSLPYAWIGMCCEAQGENGQAVLNSGRAIQLNAEETLAYFVRANAHRKSGSLDRAITDYSKCIELRLPQMHEVYNNRGLAYAGKGKYDEAITDYTEAIALKPDYAPAYFNRGEAYQSKRLYREAEDDYNDAAKNEPKLQDEVYDKLRIIDYIQNPTR